MQESERLRYLEECLRIGRLRQQNLERQMDDCTDPAELQRLDKQSIQINMQLSELICEAIRIRKKSDS